jgi:acyl-CoA-binding protein
MSDLQAQFQQASQDVVNLSKAPDADVKLNLYALFKQGTQGDCSGPRPGMLDFIGRAKYDSWKKLEGKPQAQAMQQYIELVEQLKSADGK